MMKNKKRSLRCIFNLMKQYHSMCFAYFLYLIVDEQTCYSWPILLRVWRLLYPGLCIRNGAPHRYGWHWILVGDSCWVGGSPDATEQKASPQVLGWVGKARGSTLALDVRGGFFIPRSSWEVPLESSSAGRLCSPPIRPLRVPRQMPCFPQLSSRSVPRSRDQGVLLQGTMCPAWEGTCRLCVVRNSISVPRGPVNDPEALSGPSDCGLWTRYWISTWLPQSALFFECWCLWSRLQSDFNLFAFCFEEGLLAISN